MQVQAASNSASDSPSATAGGEGSRSLKESVRKRWKILQNRIERARDLRRKDGGQRPGRGATGQQDNAG
jgi:hypothetical protein